MLKAHWWEDDKEIEKLASQGYSTTQIEALVKEAARQKELQDVLADFDAAGRIMAHGYYDELCKIAQAAAEEGTKVSSESEPQKQAEVKTESKLDKLKKLLSNGE